MDIRVASTKTRIKQSLLKCLKEQPFSVLHNSDIIKTAEISSRTFYQYYINKEEVLTELENDFISGLREAMKEDRKFLKDIGHTLSIEEIKDTASEAFRYTIDYCANYKDVAHILLSDNGDIKFWWEIIRTSRVEFIERFPYLFSAFKKTVKTFDGIPATFVMNIYVGTIINVIMNWLKYNDALSAEQIRKFIGKVQVAGPVQLIKQSEDVN